MSKELVTMDSLADAKTMIKVLHRNPNDDYLRATFVNSTTPSAYPFLVAVKYIPQWIVEKADTWKENEILVNGLPGWCQTAREVGAAIHASTQIVQNGGTIDLGPLRILRSLVLRKLLKPMLSGGLGVGVPTHPPDKGRSRPSHEAARVKAAANLIFTMATSLIHHPDQVTSHQFRASGVVEIAARCWWYYSEDLVARCESTMGLCNLIISANCDKNVLDTVMRTIPADKVAKQCKMVLQSWLPPNKLGIAEKFNQCSELQLIHALCTPQVRRDSIGVVLSRGVYHELGVALLNAGVHLLVLEVATRAIDSDAQQWLKMHSVANILLSLFGATPDPLATITPYIDKGGLLALVSRLFTDNSFYDEKDVWFEILEVLEFNACGERPGSRTPRAEAYADAIRRALRHKNLYDHTLVKLEALTRASGNKSMRMKRLRAWYELGKDVELVGREAFLNPPVHSNEDDRHGCWWSECARRRSDKRSDKELLRCAGCKKAKYCSRECQTKDWKEQHKTTCKSMRGP